MKNVIEFIKNNKVKIIVICIIILIILCLCGVLIFLNIDSKQKQYYVEEVSEYKYFELKQGDKYGVVDCNGNIVIESNYDSVKIPNPSKDIFICKTGDKKSIFNENKEELFTQYEDIDAIQINGVVSSIPYEKTVLKYRENGKYGLLSYTGKQITKPIYDEISGLQNKESELLVKENGKCGVINSKGAKLIKPEYDDIVADGFYTTESKYALSGYITCNKTDEGYRYGYINSKHEQQLEVKYNELERILTAKDEEDVYLIASKNGRYGILKNGNELLKHEYQSIEYDDTNKVFRIQRNNKIGIADISGNIVVPVEYKEIELKGIYLQAINDNDESMYFDTKGNVENIIYESIIKTNSDKYYISIDKEGKYGILDNEKVLMIENKYSYIEYLFDDYFIASDSNGHLGIINKDDETVVDFIYDVLQKIDDTNVVEAKVLKENKTELYSKSLEKICSIINAYVYKQNNYIHVYFEDEMKYFDLDGKEIENVDIFTQNELFAMKNNGKWGYKDADGNTIVEPIYDEVTEINEFGFGGIKKDGKWGIIDKTGKIIVNPIYEIEQSNSKPEFLGKFYRIYYGYGQSYFTDQVN